MMESSNSTFFLLFCLSILGKNDYYKRNIMIDLKDNVIKWQEIRAGKATYKEGSTPEQSSEFYYDCMLEDIIKTASQKWQQDQKKGENLEVNMLVSLSGFSPATTILAFRLLKPKRLFIIASEKAEKSIDIIHRFVVGNQPDRLPARMFRHEECDPSQPHSIYELVKRELERIKNSPDYDPSQCTVIDLTGGKKVMSAAAALVAWQLDLRLCYIDSDYDPSLRQPRPGTERLILLDNPMTLYGDAELKRANEVFKVGHFAAASDRFRELAERTGNPMARFIAELSALYVAVCDLDMDSLLDGISKVRSQLKDVRIRRCLPDCGSLYDQQMDLLDGVAQRDPLLLNLCYFVLGEHYARLARYDFAVLLFYRMIEGSFRLRLEQLFPDFDTRHPDYSKTDKDPAKLLADYNSVAREISQDECEIQLPRSIGLMSAAGLLLALKDCMMSGQVAQSPKDLGRFKRLAALRNDSVFAHGYQTVTEDTCKEFQRAAKVVLEALWTVSKKPECCSGKFLDDIRLILAFQQPEL